MSRELQPASDGQAMNESAPFGDAVVGLCGIGFFFKHAARSIKEPLLPAREQGLTDLKLATNLSGAFLAGQDLQDCAGFLLGLERKMFFNWRSP